MSVRPSVHEAGNLVVFKGLGDLDIDDFLSGVERSDEGRNDWTTLPVVRDAVHTWLLVARRLKVPRGVDSMVTRYLQSLKGWEALLGLRLRCRGTGLSVMPERIANLRRLWALDVSSCKLGSDWPMQMAQLPILEWLQASGNRMARVPEVVSRMTTLQQLFIGSNNFSSFFVEELPPKLETLDMSGNEVSYVPDLSALRELQFLSLERNKLTSFPENVCACVSLRNLALDSNRIEKLPPAIGQLVNLTRLSLVSNWVAAIPPEFGLLVSLKTVLLRDNLIAKIADEISNLQSLKMLDMDDNRLEELPFTLGDLPADCVVAIAKNGLGKIPPELRTPVMGEELRQFLRRRETWTPPLQPPPPVLEVVEEEPRGCCSTCVLC